MTCFCIGKAKDCTCKGRCRCECTCPPKKWHEGGEDTYTSQDFENLLGPTDDLKTE